MHSSISTGRSRQDRPSSWLQIAAAGILACQCGVAAAQSRGRGASAQPSGKRDQPVPAPARAQSGRLVSLGARGVREGEGREQADLPVDRLQLVLLVPRHGARELHGRRDRQVPQRAFRVHQGRSRGTAGRRPGLHDRAPGVQHRRLADVDVPARPMAALFMERPIFPRAIARDSRVS